MTSWKVYRRMSEENSFGGRLRRYATVTTKMSGVAARLAELV